MLQPAHFTVQTVDAGVGEVLVYIEDPEGHTEEVWRAAEDEREWHGLRTRDHGLLAGLAWRWLPELTTRPGSGGSITVGAARHCGVSRGCSLCDFRSFPFPIGQSGSQQ